MHKRILISLFIVLTVVTPSIYADQDLAKADGIVTKAKNSVNTFTIDPNMQWLRNNMDDAKGVFIVPELVKAGLIFGGSGGTGVFLVKGEGNIWSDPAFYTMGSGTVGFQLGVEVSEIILMVMTDKGVDALLTSSFKLGGDVSVAAGPVGAGAKAQIADILAFSRTKGIYGGINIEGAVIKIRNKLNNAYYKGETSPRNILIERSATNPDADSLRTAVANLAIKSAN